MLVFIVAILTVFIIFVIIYIVMGQSKLKGISSNHGLTESKSCRSPQYQ